MTQDNYLGRRLTNRRTADALQLAVADNVDVKWSSAGSGSCTCATARAPADRVRGNASCRWSTTRAHAAVVHRGRVGTLQHRSHPARGAAVSLRAGQRRRVGGGAMAFDGVARLADGTTSQHAARLWPRVTARACSSHGLRHVSRDDRWNATSGNDGRVSAVANHAEALWGVHEVARFLKVPIKTLYQSARRATGRGAPCRPGGCSRVPARDRSSRLDRRLA
jgi:hypothetical protein